VLAPKPAMPPGAMPEQQPMPAPKWHDVTVKSIRKTECARVMGVPPEEFGISSSARNIRDCGYCFHATPRAEGDLISEGYNAEQVKKLPTHRPYTTTEQTARDTVDESAYAQASDTNRTRRMVLITEHYIEMDYEDNDKPAIYRVVTGEHFEPLEKDDEDTVCRVEMFPFAAMTPVIMTHRFWGRSIADLVMDVQRIKTALVRGLLDNLYMRNNFRTEVSEAHASDNTIDDLLLARPGGIVRTKQPGGVTPLQVEDVSQAVYPALQYFDATREWRTGVSRQGQGIDPNALQNQVATIANQMEMMSDKKIKLIARIFADTGIRDLFSLLHAIIRKHGSKAQTVRLRNQWVDVDPREWKQRDDLTIKVGLGSGNKAQQMAGIQMIVQSQIQGVQAGLVSKNNFWHSAQALCKVLGYPDAAQFFVDPNAPADPQDPNSAALPPPPDPKHSEIAAKAQAEQAKIQADAAHQQMKTQADINFQQWKAKIDAEREQQKAQMDMALAQQKFNLDRELAVLKGQLEERQAHHAMAMKEADMHAKAQQRATPKASIEVKHGANEITGPLADAIGQFGNHMTAMHERMHQALNQHAEMMHQTIKQASAPKRVVRDKNNRVSHVETMQ
jgi:hypothetical protein